MNGLRLVVGLLVTLASAPALAEPLPHDAATAQALFDDGKRLVQQHSSRRRARSSSRVSGSTQPQAAWGDLEAVVVEAWATTEQAAAVAAAAQTDQAAAL